MTPPPDNPKSSRGGFLRTAIEFGVCLAVAVMLFRTFAAEGYMIKTGSMAPCLLGYYRLAMCPSCRYSFAVDDGHGAARAACPNCGLEGIVARDLVRNDGDQLLVQRAAYEYRKPRRWEIVVFRNPMEPTQAYVKRLVALPGESVQIAQGDIYISGQIQTKSLSTQRGMRIPVYDDAFRPPESDLDWKPRWVADGEDNGWLHRGGAFVFDGLSAKSPAFSKSRTSDPDAIRWVRYRHWVRRGGSHATSVRIDPLPASLDLTQAAFESLRFDQSAGTLICRGAMPRDLHERLLRELPDAGSQRAIEQLYEASHVAPITDTYGYNRARDGSGGHEVRDLMLALQLSISGGKGEFVLGITDGTHDFECRFDTVERQVRLIETRTESVLRTAAIPVETFPGRALVEFSLMDRQVLLAINGEPVFDPWNFPAPQERGPTPWQPVRFGATGLQVQVTGLKLYRDVYYTSGEGRRGFDAPVRLGPEEYFALGDNSPVSRDSRSWPEGKVLTADLLLGKPFLVHLPSRKRRIQFGRWQMDIRIPEFSQVRYIR